MADPNSHDQDLLRELVNRVKNLESRLATVEKELDLEGGPWFRRKKAEGPQGIDLDDAERIRKEKDSSAIESSVGEYGLAWIGNIVLLFGLTFLTQYIQNLGYIVLASAIGFVSVALILLLSHFVKNATPYLSKIFLNTGQLLLFYFLVRLHFFTSTPVIANASLATGISVAVILSILILWIVRKNPWFTGMWLLFLLCAAVFSNEQYLLLSATVMISLTAVLLYYRNNWWKLLNFSIVISYLAYLIWLINNPVMGNEARILSAHNYGHFFLLACGALYTSITLKKDYSSIPENSPVFSTILNGIGFTLLLLLFILAFFKENYPGLLLAISVFCLGYSLWLKKMEANKLLTAFYALYSFLALSGAIYGLYELPRVFFFLSLESLLVLSIALWYRSRFIVVMNSILFILLLIAYWVSPGQLDGTNLSFAVVALATARILNWQKDRLEIKTEFLRNVYLVSGFVLVLYALYEALPGNFITLSWTLMAILYFILSLLLKNIKYRYMALGTFISTAIYLFVVDLARVEILYRVIAFMFLAIITIAVSVFYTRRSRKKAGST